MIYRTTDLTREEWEHLVFCESWHEGKRCPPPTPTDWDEYRRIMHLMGCSLETSPLPPEPTEVMPWELPSHTDLSTAA